VLRQFRAFLTESNAFALAIGFIMGVAVAKLVSAVVDDVLMPIIGLAMPGGDWRNAKFVLSGQSAILYGHLLGSILDFIIIAFVLFLIVKWIVRPKPPVPMRTCPECLETIPAAAKRCKFCGV